MNIFYYSVHQILEDDEVRLFQDLGHNVFVFGSNRRDGAIQLFRPSIAFNPTERAIFDSYEQLGGKFDRNDENGGFPAGFEGHFSAFVIMHDVSFIMRFWPRLKGKFVVWRTIGQGVDHFDAMIAPLRAQGLRVVRYSPLETGFANHCGEDAVIRFFKNPNQYSNWVGDVEKVLTFSNSFSQRYPAESEIYREVCEQLPCAIGGAGNEDLVQSTGFATFEDQLKMYRDYRVYLYISGLEIPYTLNFMEAWMTGIPVVAYVPEDRKGRYFEIDRLIKHGEDGFICRSAEEIVSTCRVLLGDRSVAQKIGKAGRASAIRYFGRNNISGQWKAFLSTA